MSAAPGARAASAPLLGHETEPTMFEMSVDQRKSFQLRTTGVPESKIEDMIPRGASERVGDRAWSSSPSATWWVTSRGSPIANFPLI